MKKITFFLFVFLVQFQFSWPCFANEEVSKLPEDQEIEMTVRFLQVSDTKKTVLINRGSEDGVEVGKHARFFLTKGVVARGEVIEVSPKRSIWSLYRLVLPSDIKEDQLVKANFTAPLKTTTDASRSIASVEDETNTELEKLLLEMNGNASSSNVQNPQAIQVSPVASSATSTVSQLSIQAPTPTPSPSSYNFQDRSWEVFTHLQMNALSMKSTMNEQGASGKSSLLGISLGVEKHLDSSSNFWRRFSPFGFFHLSQTEQTSLAGDVLFNKVFEYGLGSKILLGDPTPWSHSFLPFLSFSLGVGNTEDTQTFNQVVNSSKVSYQQGLIGSSFFWAIGIGAKYYFSSGLGITSSLDWYYRRETYIVNTSSSSNSTDYVKTLMGPRLLMGLLYRF